ncbi:hypothetical protein ACHAXR_012975 [Thalassiosira sp. AJA248-18]
MIHTRLTFVASLVMVSSHLPSSRMKALAFTTSTSPSSLQTKAASGVSSSRLFYQAGTAEAYATAEQDTIARINDSNYEAILENSHGSPVLVDCFVSKCGPCKLIEQSIQSIQPKYSDEEIIFSKWDVNEKENSMQFMNLLRENEMTFRKLPTVILFIDGVPMAMRSGMATAGQLDQFLEDNLSLGADDECVDEVNLEGEKFRCGE